MKFPVFFFSHGSPMFAVEHNEWTDAWATAMAKFPVPLAILAVSAHWETAIPSLTGSAAPETIHDFYGFPPELYRLQYPAKGNPGLAADIAKTLHDTGIKAVVDEDRGIDHGAWVPLRWMYPNADIPVIELSVQPRMDGAHHIKLGRALQLLREQGVLVVGSGHMTHNLRDYMYGVEDARPAKAFRNWTRDRIMRGAVDDLAGWTKAPHAMQAHPTPDHFLPLLVAVGAAGEDYTARQLCDGYTGRVLAMDSFIFE
ncbi:Extradiol aromatic ring-opening dioxygenase DODA type [Carpediemonas membranifera]|uniref:Extradiol aromatic ring-opening dioxygenase DODA type n=1 Tax=Carpediemonas membranifera TaxID=201153 RepID=A0A8J6B7W6_9EUKA|nr:Extradiol aromatic ring-opening dioxygenase DODA type [Carpediemonas membranifera]|eukprot:KAG9396094.1 Extradiol aromatic ring-opening dioxygenase DODA type [Carpediemonas membranifera]